jgi:hypothetical protein
MDSKGKTLYHVSLGLNKRGGGDMRRLNIWISFLKEDTLISYSIEQINSIEETFISYYI